MPYKNETDYHSGGNSNPVIGEIYKATVETLNPFGATVVLHPREDQMGSGNGDRKSQLRGLIHISQIAETRIDNIADELHEGQEVEVMVIQPDERGRTRLSMKAVPKGKMPQVGQTYTGRVVKLEQYGAFVHLPDFNRDGLVHITELSFERVADIYSFLALNKDVRVKVLAIETDLNTGRIKIKLSLKQADS